METAATTTEDTMTIESTQDERTRIEHQGVAISDLTTDETGRFSVDPTYYPIEVTDDTATTTSYIA